MSSGHILVAEHKGIYVIKLVGDVRLTLCVSFDQFIAGLFAGERFKPVVFDLRQAEGIDSTTLGLMAKISLGSRERGLENPVVVAQSPSIERLLISMGFEDIFKIMTGQASSFTETDDVNGLDLTELVDDEGSVEARVLEAHQILMELNVPNKVKFRELVEALQDKK